MNNKLPSVFVGKQHKKISNNKEWYYFKDNNNYISENIEARNLNELFVQKKINDIFASPKFIYKVNVFILTNKGEKKETIIAKNHDSLITIKNDKILISDIQDIKILN
jgi:hypothetical protein